MSDTLIGVPGIQNLSGEGRRAIVDVARSLGIDPDWLATIISFESARTFNPAEKNPYSGATGMIQFMPSTAERLGTTVAQIAKMSQAEQIRGPIYHYFNSFGRLGTLDDTYLAVFFPAAIGKSDDYVVGTRDGTEFQQAVYNQNRGFDGSGAGVIRRGDIVSTIRGLYQRSLVNPRVPVPASGLLQTGFLLALFGVAAYGIYQWGIGRA